MSIGGWIILAVLGTMLGWHLYQRHVAAASSDSDNPVRRDFLDRQRWRK